MPRPEDPRPMRHDRRMTDAEALMWTVEKDPALRSSFLQVTLLDRAPDFDRFRSRMARAVEVIPRLRQRVVPPPARFAPPEWADDPYFNLDFHVRRLAVPSPGSDRQLFDLAALLYEDAFDRARPLWNLTIVEGLEGGRAALLVKMHHTITDGVGGVRLSMEFLDLSRDAPEPPPVVRDGDAYDESAIPRGAVEVTAEAAAHNVRRLVGIAQRATRDAVEIASRPADLPRRAGDVVETVRSIARQGLVTDPARSPLWTERSLVRRFEALTLDLDAVKRAAKDLGGTVNDLYVTALAGSAGAYHRARGEDVEELRLSMPISRRDDNSAGGNAFSPSRVLVPAGAMSPRERFQIVHERLGVTKRERGLAVVDSLAGVLNNLPTSLLTRVARQQVETVDFAASNLKAADFELYVAGALILANHPMGPTAGTAFNATVMSYRNRFDIGLNIDSAAIPDHELLRASIEDAFAELLS